VDRSQSLVLDFFLVAWVSQLVILVVAPEVYDQALRLPGRRGAELAFLVAVSGFIGLLAVGCVALALDVLVDPGRVAVRRAPGAGGGVAAHRGPRRRHPTWYVLYQGLLGMAQFGIGLVMVVGYRHAGFWGSS
jgi:hypothetical protein